MVIWRRLYVLQSHGLCPSAHLTFNPSRTCRVACTATPGSRTSSHTSLVASGPRTYFHTVLLSRLIRSGERQAKVQWAHSILSRISSTQQPACGVRETAQRLPVGVYLRPIGERNVGVHVKRRTGQCRRVIAKATDLVVNYLVVVTLIRHPGLINKAVVHR